MKQRVRGHRLLRLDALHTKTFSINFFSPDNANCHTGHAKSVDYSLNKILNFFLHLYSIRKVAQSALDDKWNGQRIHNCHYTIIPFLSQQSFVDKESNLRAEPQQHAYDSIAMQGRDPQAEPRR